MITTIYIYTFFTIYNPSILPFSTLHLCAIIALLSIIKHWNEYKYRFLSVINIICFLFLIIIYMFFVISIGEGSFIDLYRLGSIIFEMIPCACYISYTCKKKKVHLEKVIIYSALIEGIIAIILFLSPKLQYLVINNMVTNGYPNSYLKFISYRLYGLSYSMLYAMPIVNAAIGMYTIYYALKTKIVYFFVAFIIIFSAIINARIAFVPIIFGGIYLIYLIMLKKKNICMKSLIKIISTAVLIILGLIIFNNIISKNKIIEKWILKGFNDIIAILFRHDNGSKYYSYYVGNERWHLPKGIFSVLFGTGKRVIRGNLEYSSDIGYINDLWWGGIIYCILIYLFILYTVYYIYKSRIRKELHYLGFVAILILAIVNVKGNVVGTNEISCLIVILYISSLDRYRLKKVKSIKTLRDNKRLN